MFPVFLIGRGGRTPFLRDTRVPGAGGMVRGGYANVSKR